MELCQIESLVWKIAMEISFHVLLKQLDEFCFLNLIVYSIVMANIFILQK
jgi:hypothetical protein